MSDLKQTVEFDSIQIDGDKVKLRRDGIVVMTMNIDARKSSGEIITVGGFTATTQLVAVEVQP